MAQSVSDKGGMAANACIVLILVVCAFAGGMLTANGGVPAGFPFGINPTTTTTTNSTTTTTTTTEPTTTTTTTVVEPPPDTEYKIYLRVYFTVGLFNEDTEGIVVLKYVDGNQDAYWSIMAYASSNNMTGASDVPRHTKASTIGKSVIISVPSKGWEYTIVIGSNWDRTPTGVGDYVQNFELNSMANLFCQVWLTPRWSG